MSMPVGRPPKHDRLPPRAELMEVTLCLGSWLNQVPVAVVWEEKRPMFCRGRVLSIDGQPCEPWQVVIYGNETKSDERVPDDGSRLECGPRRADHE